jgi:DNA-binding transcriptional regulator YhcF (GntR family)
VVSSLAINPNTVLKAYRDLESKDLAAGRPGQGTFAHPVGLGELVLAYLREPSAAALPSPARRRAA